MEPVGDPKYWAERLRTAPMLHHAVFKCPLDRWLRIEDNHRRILAKTLKKTTSILDCGCGYGRLLELLPPWWIGEYLGIDLSRELVDLAVERHGPKFVCADMRVHIPAGMYELAVLISVRPMIQRNLGEEVWNQMEYNIRQHVKRILYLEYDEKDEGELV